MLLIITSVEMHGRSYSVFLGNISYVGYRFSGCRSDISGIVDSRDPRPEPPVLRSLVLTYNLAILVKVS